MTEWKDLDQLLTEHEIFYAYKNFFQFQPLWPPLTCDLHQNQQVSSFQCMLIIYLPLMRIINAASPLEITCLHGFSFWPRWPHMAFDFQHTIQGSWTNCGTSAGKEWDPSKVIGITVPTWFSQSDLWWRQMTFNLHETSLLELSGEYLLANWKKPETSWHILFTWFSQSDFQWPQSL